MVIKREMSLNPVVFEEFSGGDGAGGWKESMYACVGVCANRCSPIHCVSPLFRCYS